jgi:hypothetical protein
MKKWKWKEEVYLKIARNPRERKGGQGRRDQCWAYLTKEGRVGALPWIRGGGRKAGGAAEPLGSAGNGGHGRSHLLD